VELAIVQAVGFAAERRRLSGASRGRFGGDVSIPLLGVDRRVEVKARANRFRRLYDWLGDHDFLIIKADRFELLVVLPLRFAAEIAAIAGRAERRSTEMLRKSRIAAGRNSGKQRKQCHE
jgi:hypothetical protein